MVILTKEQRAALFKLYQRDFPSWRTPRTRTSPTEGVVKTSSFLYRTLRKRVVAGMDGSGCIMLPWKGMWIGIERDGYIHS